MATSSEKLKEVLKETLDNRGILGQIRARIRAEVFSALDDQSETRPTLSNENMLINELIREYLEFNNYKYTLSVLLTESGQPKDPIDRRFLAEELNITEDHATASTPLLYSMMTHFIQSPHKDSIGKRRREELAASRQSARDHFELSDTSGQSFSHEAGHAFVVRGGAR
ncbi:predicted protein [Nematostella vectensis]|uniref:Centrosomal protein 20 n=1 Tax=Nematostella vectensis TaxID=45351 RepID=A7S3A6_NEMVE|nr:predicted protein [Nematostella vectensis]|eukprot:XP_001633880.1 predicted protein [Nematostella vectensis]